jgi:hypothetical protein
VAIVHRALLLGDPRLFGAPRVVPHNFRDLSILLFVVSDREHCACDGSSPGRERRCRGQRSMSSSPRDIGEHREANCEDFLTLPVSVKLRGGGA